MPTGRVVGEMTGLLRRDQGLDVEPVRVYDGTGGVRGTRQQASALGRESGRVPARCAEALHGDPGPVQVQADLLRRDIHRRRHPLCQPLLRHLTRQESPSHEGEIRGEV